MPKPNAAVAKFCTIRPNGVPNKLASSVASCDKRAERTLAELRLESKNATSDGVVDGFNRSFG